MHYWRDPDRVPDTDTRLMRWRLIETLVETASPPEVQIRKMLDGGFPYEELARQFWDCWDRVPTLEKRGALTPAATAAIGAVQAAFEEIVRAANTTNDDDPWTADAIRERQEWDAVRRAATSALREFELMGLPIPKLSDADFNTPRTDAP